MTPPISFLWKGKKTADEVMLLLWEARRVVQACVLGLT